MIRLEAGSLSRVNANVASAPPRLCPVMQMFWLGLVGAIARDTLRDLAPNRVKISLEAGMNQSARFRCPINLRVGRFVLVVVGLGATDGQQGVAVVVSEVTAAGVGAVNKAVSDGLRSRITRCSEDSLKVGERHSLLYRHRAANTARGISVGRARRDWF